MRTAPGFIDDSRFASIRFFVEFDQRNMQRHDVGARKQVVEIERFGLELRRDRGVGDGRIEEGDAGAGLLEPPRDRSADHAHPDDADEQAFEALDVFAEQPGADRAVIAAANGGARLQEAAKQHGRARDRVFGDGVVAAARDVGDRNAERLEAAGVDPVDAGAGDLDEPDRAVGEKLERKLRPDGRERQAHASPSSRPASPRRPAPCR